MRSSSLVATMSSAEHLSSRDKPTVLRKRHNVRIHVQDSADILQSRLQAPTETELVMRPAEIRSVQRARGLAESKPRAFRCTIFSLRSWSESVTAVSSLPPFRRIALNTACGHARWAGGAATMRGDGEDTAATFFAKKKRGSFQLQSFGCKLCGRARLRK
jgi:hypothetical protein